MSTEAEKRASVKYSNKMVRTFCFRFVKTLDADIIAQLNKQPSKMDYVRTLIREDIKRKGQQS